MRIASLFAHAGVDEEGRGVVNPFIVTAAIAMAVAGGVLTGHYLDRYEDERPAVEAQYEQMFDKVKTAWRFEDEAR